MQALEHGQLQPYSHVLEHSWECQRKVLPLDRSLAVHLLFHLAWKERWPDAWSCTKAWAWLMVWLDRDLERTCLNNWWQGEDICGEISVNRQKKVKIFVSHRNGHLKVTSSEEDFNACFLVVSEWWTEAKFVDSPSQLLGTEWVWTNVNSYFSIDFFPLSTATTFLSSVCNTITWQAFVKSAS